VLPGATGRLAPLEVTPTSVPPVGALHHLIKLPADVALILAVVPGQIVTFEAVGGAGAAITVITWLLVVVHPVLLVTAQLIVAVPAETPLTTPVDALTVATPVLLLLQTPLATSG
jgi:hypothetical protein